MDWRYLQVVLIGAGFSGIAAAAQPEVKPPVQSAGDVERLVSQLGSEVYAEREQASERLGQIGRSALPAVERAVSSNDPEVRARAAILVQFINRKPLPEVAPTEQDQPGHPQEVRVVRRTDGLLIMGRQQGRTIRLAEQDDGPLSLWISGWRDGEAAVERYDAPDAAQLMRENPEVYSLYRQWSAEGQRRWRGEDTGLPPGIGGDVEVGCADIVSMQVRLEAQMQSAGTAPARQVEILGMVDRMAEQRSSFPGQQGEQYLATCDQLREQLASAKLPVPDDILPPPGAHRLGVELQQQAGGNGAEQLLVRNVLPDSRAERIGLKEGDVIRKVGGQEVGSVDQLREVIASSDTAEVELLRNGQTVVLKEH